MYQKYFITLYNNYFKRTKYEDFPKLVAIALCACMYAPTQTYAYSERNILQKEFVADSLRAYLVPGQKWVKYPAYADRTGWDNRFRTE